MRFEAEFFTESHVIHGFIDTPGERLSDHMNNKKEQAVDLTRVQCARLFDLGKTPPANFVDTRLEKPPILFAIPVEQDVTHKSLFRRAARQSFRISLLLPNFEITGNIHLTEPLDIDKVLITRPETFIPLTDVSVLCAVNPAININAKAIVFNKDHVHMIAEVIKQEPLPQAK